MAVVDLVLTGGQSQMSGVGNSAQAPATDPAKAWEWNTGPGLVQVVDPTSSSGSYKAQTGSCLPSFANTFAAASGRPLVVVRAAVGGTSLLAANTQANGHWDTSGALFGNSVSRAQAAIAAIAAAGHTLGKVFVIWSQGYADAKVGNSLELYEAANAALVTRWRTALGIADLSVYQERMYAPAAAPADVKPRCLQVRDAQLASVATTPGLKIAFTEGEEYAARGWLKFDNLHYNQTGLNYMGVQFARYVAQDLGFEPPVTPPASGKATTSNAARLLMLGKPLPPLPRVFGVGTTRWTVPAGVTSVVIEGVGAGGNGGNGVAGLKGGAGGGGAYVKVNALAVTPGEEYDVVVRAGGTESASYVSRVVGSVLVWRAGAGRNGVNGNPNGDGIGGTASESIGDVKTSGQNGGVSGIDNGGAGAPPLGGAGGVGPGPNQGTFPGGGGAGAMAGATQLGGAGAAGTIKISSA